MLIFVLITLGCVSANDVNETDDVMATDGNSINEEILIDEASETGTFTDLRNEIEQATSDNVELTKDYTFNNETDAKGSISLNNPNLVLDGKGHTINAKDQTDIFFIFIEPSHNITIKNIIFMNGYSSRDRGAAIEIERNSAHIINCTFINNKGEAIFDYGSSTIEDCTFINNTASQGGAIYGGSYTKLFNCKFINNTAGNGGAIQFNEYHTIKNCEFINNTGENGGAIFYRSGLIENCTFINNSVNRSGGAIYISEEYYSLPHIKNCIFINNTANKDEKFEYSPGGGAVFIRTKGTVENSKFINNTALQGGGILAYLDGTIKNCEFINNTALTHNGGGVNIRSQGSVADSTFINNNAINGGGLSAWKLVLTNSVFNRNTAKESGGAVSVTNGDVKNCQFIENIANESGGALNIINAINITNCDFEKNMANNTPNDYDSQNNDTVIKLVYDTIITANNANYVINYGGKYSVTLKDVKGRAVSGEKITFILNGKNIGSAITNSNGIATLKLTAGALKTAKYGTKNMVIKFDGSNNYNPTSKTVKVTIKKESAKITAKKKTFKKSVKVKKYAITLKNSKGKAIKKAKVILKIKGKTYTAKTNTKGKATFKIKKLTRKGKYNARITFKTTALYLKATKKVKITIK